MTGWIKKNIEALSNGATVVTVNRRLSQHLQRTYKEAKLEAGVLAWETPAILPVGTWLLKLYEEVGKKPVLAESRTRAMWLGIVQAGLTGVERSVLFAQGVGEVSFSAYKLMGEYCLTGAELGSEIYMTEEARAFKGWLAAYNRKLASSGFIDRTVLKRTLIDEIKRGSVTLPAKVIFAGFDELTPVLRLLVSTLKKNGVEVEDVGSTAPGDPSRPATQPVLKEYPNEVNEVRAAARWAREKLGASNSVGVVVTDINRYGTLLEREFAAELDPLSVLPWQASAGVYNISLGAPLYNATSIRSAFSLLSISSSAISVESITTVLFTLARYLGSSTLAATSVFDARLKRDKKGSLPLEKLYALLQKSGNRELAALAEKVEAWAELLKKEGTRELPGHWAHRFAALLKHLGWQSVGGFDKRAAPGSNGKGLTSTEYQVAEAWQSVLVDFACFDDTLGRLTRTEAVAELKRLTVETIHKIQSKDAPVQVLGLFEAAGLHFDHMLLLGADSTTLPSLQSPNPFIPVELQKRLNFKDSTPERTLSFASTVLARLLRSAPVVEISYSRTFGGVDTARSPLLQGIEPTVVTVLKKSESGVCGSSLKEGLHASYALEEFADEPELPLSEQEVAGLRGGTGIIKDQSACPFKAFATYRLGARTVAGVVPGFDSLDRGSTVHEALKFFWREVKDSKKLKDSAEKGELAVLVKSAVTQAVEASRGRNLPEAYLELECLRVEELVTEWLELELTREDFTVKATEYAEKIEIGGLVLNACFDRVDTLEGGGELILDYKTGVYSKDSWLPGRPIEPQLLLYDLVGGFDAVSFGQVKIKNTKFVAVAKDGAGLPGTLPIADDKWTQKIDGVNNWEELKQRWKETLEELAKEFMDGVTTLTPYASLKNSYPCNYCDLTTLCRRFELNSTAEGER